MDDPGFDISARSLEVVHDAYMPMCPRCSYSRMEEHTENVAGAVNSYTHQCTKCGMGVHHTTWDAALLKSGNDLLKYLELTTWEEFEHWVDDFTSGLAYIRFAPAEREGGVDELTSLGADYGQVIQFPTTIREVMFDLLSAEDNARMDWRAFSGEAARRLVPLSEVYNTPLDPEQEKMPEDWEEDDDGRWGSKARPKEQT